MSSTDKLRMTDFIWFSDEAHFYLEGYVSKQNNRINDSENYHEFLIATLHPKLHGQISEPFNVYC